MPRLRVLLTHERFAPDFGGGGEYVVLEIARRLIARGVDLRILVAGDRTVTEFEGIPTTRIGIPRHAFPLALPRILRAARDRDLVQTFNYHAALPSYLAARMRGLPCICHMLGLFDAEWLTLRGGVAGRVWRGWERMLLRLPFDRTVFLSDFSRDLGIRLGAKPERSEVNEPGIELDRFKPAGTKTPTVLFVGKWEERKGLSDVLAIAARLPDYPFRVVGWGENEAGWRAAAPPNLTFVPFQRGAALEAEFARASVFLFPSRAETFGLVVAQAMSAGCAIVSSVPLGFDGPVARPGDIDGMTTMVHRFLTDKDALATTGARNQAAAQRFDWDRHIDRLLALYEQVLAARSKRTVAAAGPGTL